MSRVAKQNRNGSGWESAAFHAESEMKPPQDEIDAILLLKSRGYVITDRNKSRRMAFIFSQIHTRQRSTFSIGRAVGMSAKAVVKYLHYLHEAGRIQRHEKIDYSEEFGFYTVYYWSL